MTANSNWKVRLSLEELKDIVHNAFWGEGKVKGDVLNALRRANVALNEPPKNHEIGSPEEQYARFKKLCDRVDCCDCPVHKRWNFKVNGDESCHFVWMQMPYKKEEVES